MVNLHYNTYDVILFWFLFATQYELCKDGVNVLFNFKCPASKQHLAQRKCLINNCHITYDWTNERSIIWVPVISMSFFHSDWGHKWAGNSWIGKQYLLTSAHWPRCGLWPSHQSSCYPIALGQRALEQEKWAKGVKQKVKGDNIWGLNPKELVGTSCLRKKISTSNFGSASAKERIIFGVLLLLLRLFPVFYLKPPGLVSWQP